MWEESGGNRWYDRETSDLRDQTRTNTYSWMDKIFTKLRDITSRGWLIDFGCAEIVWSSIAHTICRYIRVRNIPENNQQLLQTLHDVQGRVSIRRCCYAPTQYDRPLRPQRWRPHKHGQCTRRAEQVQAMSEEVRYHSDMLTGTDFINLKVCLTFCRYMFTKLDNNQMKAQFEYKALLDRLATVRKMNSGTVAHTMVGNRELTFYHYTVMRCGISIDNWLSNIAFFVGARGIMEEHADSMDPLLKELLGKDDDHKVEKKKNHSPKVCRFVFIDYAKSLHRNS